MSLSPSRLGDENSCLVLDASVLLNLLGTNRPELVFRTLCRSCVIDEVAISEVKLHPITHKPCAEFLESLQTERLLEVVNMQGDVYDSFLNLTGAEPPDDLGDGEAATIAHAVAGKHTAVLDERKATRIALGRLPGARVLASVDLLCAPDLFAKLGNAVVLDLLFLALRNSRMRVPQQMRSWVISALGPARVSECPSLRFAPRLRRVSASK